MDLTPAERAVLMQVRDLFGEASITAYRLASLMARWPEAHQAANQLAFDGLVKKGLLIQRPGEQMFSLTSTGLKAMI